MAKRPRPKAAPVVQAARPVGPDLLWLLPLGLAICAYWNALDNPWVYDDRWTVVDNPSLRDPSNWRLLLGYSPFRPLVNLSYALDRALWGLRPWGYHLTNLILHLVNVALLYVFAGRAAADAKRRAGAPRSIRAVALVAAALYAVHPLLSEAVGYVSARSELLCGAFFLAGLCAAQRWVETDQGRWLGAYLACCALALLSKETGVALLPVAWVYDLLLGERSGRRRRAAVQAGLLIVLLAGGVVRLSRFVGAESQGLERGLAAQWRTESVIVWRYLRLVALPYEQSLIHPAQTVSRALDPRPLLAFAGLGLAGYALWRVRRRWPLVSLGGVWFGAALAPSSLIPLHELMSEHRIYVAAGGLALAAACGWELAGEANPARRPMLRGFAAVIVALLLVLTVRRNRLWGDVVTLWRDTAEKAPLTWAPQYALAEALRARDGCGPATAAYRRALAASPDDLATLTNLGTCLARQHDYGEAEMLLERALAEDPHSANLLNNLGQIARLTGRPEEARRRFAEALAHHPDHAPTRLSLAALEEGEGNRGEALRLCREAAALAPQLPEAQACIGRLTGR